MALQQQAEALEQQLADGKDGDDAKPAGVQLAHIGPILCFHATWLHTLAMIHCIAYHSHS